MKAAVYMVFRHNAKEVIETYQRIFDAKIVCEHIFTEEVNPSEGLLGKIFHAELKIGDMNLYLSDSDEKPSLSSMTFKLALKEPLIEDWGCVNLYHPTLDDWKGKYGPGAPKSNGFFGPIPSNIDPTLAPKGGQVAIFGTIVPAKVTTFPTTTPFT